MWAAKNTRLDDVLSPFAARLNPSTHDESLLADLELAMQLGVVAQDSLDSFDIHVVNAMVDRGKVQGMTA